MMNTFRDFLDIPMAIGQCSRCGAIISAQGPRAQEEYEEKFQRHIQEQHSVYDFAPD